VTKLIPFLWFDTEALEAAEFYAAIFKDSAITGITRYGKAGEAVHGMKEGAVMTVDFRINGQSFVALNGGPAFEFNEAISFQVLCETQDELDHYWSRLSAGGDASAQQCGWLKDRYGLSWQVVPTALSAMLGAQDRASSERVMAAMLQMKKLDIAALEQAYDGIRSDRG
jgi:predicted 3-demethylubiquinone-9 3-methyltransferase (glyoxalase superfamily)